MPPQSSESATRYVPAAGRGALTRFYDPAIALTMRERTFRSRLVDQVLTSVAGSAVVLDVGCGTGTTALALRAAGPGTTVIGVDGDPGILARAAAKPGGSAVVWEQALAQDLPFGDHSADAVVMSLLLHHLTLTQQDEALREARRVLRPGGALHIADWGRPRDPLMYLTFTGLRLLDGWENTARHARGDLPPALRRAGFSAVEIRDRLRTMWGVLELILARPETG